MEESKIREIGRSILDVLQVDMSDLPGTLKHTQWLRNEFRARLDDLNTDYKFNRTSLELSIHVLEGAIEMIEIEMADDVPTEPHQH